MNNSYLVHHGILGQKWGVRRYQNEDGTLTAEGKARLSSEYRKAHKKLLDDMDANATSMWVKSYNSAAERMNKGLIDKYNKEFDERNAERVSQKNYRYDKDEEYERGMQEVWENAFNEEFDKVAYNFVKNHTAYMEARALVESYGKESLDSISRQDYEDMEKFFERASSR